MVSKLELLAIGILAASPTLANFQTVQPAPLVQAQQPATYQNILREVYNLVQNCKLGFPPVKIGDGFLRNPRWPGLPNPNTQFYNSIELERTANVIEIGIKRDKDGIESLYLAYIVRDPSMLPYYNSTKYYFEVPDVNNGEVYPDDPVRLKDGRGIDWESVTIRTPAYTSEMLEQFNTAMTTMRDVLKKYCNP